ncbi:xanthine dehydrogenase family protein molybdopterin-binding subunit [Jidongwangia harbinensis]|uniref:xanthine dehydrogenase family protein molybdopterin-binding subunit n=1 Tax=Jidongwangia harbinensis TaxID=2878561 RepID=UPI001CDA010F|nr:xanthine dehydrogenase family protein molybdopterin-binding subunit [Jidongwangia harbinensis]MCA2211782.1 xanthine dehydrogenase family protein molybdopterin-binding subunit [Jidongwangia harbinensis]
MADSPLGRPVNRVDGRRKVTGTAAYAADQHPDRMVHGHLLVSDVGHGTIRSMDTAAARSAPGVLAVFTPFEPLALAAGAGQNWVPLQDTLVRYHGQVIGIVVADTFEQARDAAALVRTDYDETPPAASFAAGIPTATVPTGGWEPPVVDILADGVTSIDEALAASPVVVSGNYSQPSKHHNAMEPHATVADWRDGGLVVHGGTQAPAGHARSIAAALRLDPAQVRVLSPYVGGGFGNKATTWADAVVTAAAARAVGRPVKTVLTRPQTFTVTGHRSAVAQAIALGADHDGTLIALKHDAWSSLSGSGSVFESAPGTTSRMLYRTANLHVGQKVVTLDVPPSTFMRAPGEESGSFALECAMDELATALRMDPVALRLKNYATVLPGRNVPWSSKHLDECYRVGASRFGWARRRATPSAVAEGDWWVGMGMATAVYPANRFPTSVRVRLLADGTAAVSTASADLGTGMWTVLAQLGADRLGIAMDRVRPELGDSALPANFGAFGSASTAGVAPALRDAAAAAVRSLTEIAVSDERSVLHGADPAGVEYRAGALHAGGRSVTFGALLTATGHPAVEATASGGPGGPPAEYAFHSFGAHFCEVRVNRWTAELRLSRITTVVDAGTIVNPKTARNQIEGGMLFGVGQALFEGAQVEPNGRIANANLADYLIPVNADVPPMDVHFLDHPDTVFNPAGVRGVGEIGTVGVAAAIANAVFNATGRRVRDLPITVEKLL